jgi:hydroxypyruvate reductase
MLRDIYLRTLAACDPALLVRKVLRPDMPRDVVAIGKCAGALLDGVGEHARDAFVAIPDGYRLPSVAAPASGAGGRERPPLHTDIAIGGHPDYTDASFEAGERLLRFVEAHDDLLFLISGGGSACVEVPAPGFTREQLVRENARLLASGLPIGEINAARKKMSAIKGGKLAQRVRGRCVTLVYSDVSAGALGDVASGPTIPGSDDVHLIADNATLVRAAATLTRRFAPPSPATRERDGVRVIAEQIEGDVDDAAKFLVDRLKHANAVVAGGEPTVVKRGDGKGGRCLELAVRVALHAGDLRGEALFGSSDGVDGNSGVAGVAIRLPAAIDRAAAERELARSNSLAVAQEIGEPIIIPAAGNNLRDLYLLARS